VYIHEITQGCVPVLGGCAQGSIMHMFMCDIVERLNMCKCDWEYHRV